MSWNFVCDLISPIYNIHVYVKFEQNLSILKFSHFWPRRSRGQIFKMLRFCSNLVQTCILVKLNHTKNFSSLCWSRQELWAFLYFAYKWKNWKNHFSQKGHATFWSYTPYPRIPIETSELRDNVGFLALWPSVWCKYQNNQ